LAKSKKTENKKAGGKMRIKKEIKAETINEEYV
jgi:hypothetical protein